MRIPVLRFALLWTSPACRHQHRAQDRSPGAPQCPIRPCWPHGVTSFDVLETGVEVHYTNLERYSLRGLKILSVSVDEDRSAVEAFVGTKFEMPWLHGIDTAGTKGEMPSDYGIQGIPAPVLVNSEGIIVAKSFELFGDRLEEQLEKLFDEESMLD